MVLKGVPYGVFRWIYIAKDAPFLGGPIRKHWLASSIPWLDFSSHLHFFNLASGTLVEYTILLLPTSPLLL